MGFFSRNNSNDRPPFTPGANLHEPTQDMHQDAVPPVVETPAEPMAAAQPAPAAEVATPATIINPEVQMVPGMEPHDSVPATSPEPFSAEAAPLPHPEDDSSREVGHEALGATVEPVMPVAESPNPETTAESSMDVAMPSLDTQNQPVATNDTVIEQHQPGDTSSAPAELVTPVADHSETPDTTSETTPEIKSRSIPVNFDGQALPPMAPPAELAPHSEPVVLPSPEPQGAPELEVIQPDTLPHADHSSQIAA